MSLVGCISDEVTFPLMDAIFKETKITALGAYANRYPIALAMVASGEITFLGNDYVHVQYINVLKLQSPGCLYFLK